uniref:Lipocalin/cytosolic fatty-acid binding domain-containing protein n=1 Tax=Myotis lucifugus TaxID=59463 RepID=G1QFF3_MYOLU
PKMKLLLLCLGLTLVCAHHEGNHDAVTSNFDISKISGEWHTVFLASDVKEMIEKGSIMRGFMESIHAWDNSSLTLKFHVKVNGECTEMFLLCHQANENGVYNVICKYTKMSLILSEYHGNLVLCTTCNKRNNVNNKQTFEMLILLARQPDVSPKLKERFEELCQEYGIPEENILDVTKVHRCLQARG